MTTFAWFLAGITIGSWLLFMFGWWFLFGPMLAAVREANQALASANETNAAWRVLYGKMSEKGTQDAVALGIILDAARCNETYPGTVGAKWILNVVKFTRDGKP